VSTYSIYLLGCHWGPFREISYNITNYALNVGFAGMINMYQACQELEATSYPSYIIRYSRQCPELLTLSYIKNNNTVGHARKPVSESIPSFIKREQIPNFPLSISFRWQKAEKNSSTISEYVSCGGYISL